MVSLSAAFDPGGMPDGAGIAVRAWNMMNGAIDWQALPIVSEVLGVSDQEQFIYELLAVRDYQRKQNSNV